MGCRKLMDGVDYTYIAVVDFLSYFYVATRIQYLYWKNKEVGQVGAGVGVGLGVGGVVRR